MSDRWYYCSEVRPGRLELPPEEARHAATVMRARAGEAVTVFDGRGNRASATIAQVSRRSVCVEVGGSVESAPRPAPELVLHVAVPKGARQHLLIEKCTELGASAIQPIATERSVVRPAAAALERWRRFAIEAAKQSRQAWLPEFQPAGQFAESLASAPASELRIIASAESGACPLQAVLGSRRAQAIHVWIGPEGGFTAEELALAGRAGLIAASLGPAVLRIETAALAVTALVRLSG